MGNVGSSRFHRGPIFILHYIYPLPKLFSFFLCVGYSMGICGRSTNSWLHIKAIACLVDLSNPAGIKTQLWRGFLDRWLLSLVTFCRLFFWQPCFGHRGVRSCVSFWLVVLLMLKYRMTARLQPTLDTVNTDEISMSPCRWVLVS